MTETNNVDMLLKEMIAEYAGDPRRIQHFLKVHALAALIGRGEGLDADTLFILESAALVHDIGIHSCEEKYGSCPGNLQEQEGPPLARGLLQRLNYAPSVIDRVCYLVGHHHTYTAIEGADYQILVEADFLVNLYEDDAARRTCENVYRNIFRTTTGQELCRQMFLS